MESSVNKEKAASLPHASPRLAQVIERLMVSEVAGVPAVFIGIAVAAMLFGGIVAMTST